MMMLFGLKKNYFAREKNKQAFSDSDQQFVNSLIYQYTGSISKEHKNVSHTKSILNR